MEDTTDLELYTNAGKRRRRLRALPPLTDEQKALIEQWYRYAVKVAFSRARRPYDEGEVMTAAHDALIHAVRYYRDGHGCSSIKTFYLKHLLRRLARLWKNRVAKSMASLSGTAAMEARDHRSRGGHVASVDTQEFAAYVRKRLPAEHQDVILLTYDLDMDRPEIAAQLGCSPRAVNHKRNLALRSLRDIAARGMMQNFVPRPAKPIPA